mgnify:CR=1 FL=1
METLIGLYAIACPIVSEGLNSVETPNWGNAKRLFYEFQKDLIVWKLLFKTFLIFSVESFRRT